MNYSIYQRGEVTAETAQLSLAYLFCRSAELTADIVDNSTGEVIYQFARGVLIYWNS